MTATPPRIKAVILAAGLGTRMRSRTPKVLHAICGRPMLAYVIDVAVSATGERPIVVYSPQVETVADAFADDAETEIVAGVIRRVRSAAGGAQVRET